MLSPGFIICCSLAGALGGFMQGLLGVGLGLVAVPLLTFLLPHYGISQDLSIHIAIATSMAAISVSSVSSFIGHYRRGNIRWHFFKGIVFFTTLGSILGALVAGYMPSKVLREIFALFMFYTAYRMLKNKKEEPEHHQVEPGAFMLSMGGVFIGFASSVVGIGGGLFMVPFFHYLKLPMRFAIGTSTLVSLPLSFIGSFTYIITGWQATAEMTHLWGYLSWPSLIALSLGSVLFAPLGVHYASRLPTQVLRRLFGFCVLFVGFKMVL